MRDRGYIHISDPAQARAGWMGRLRRRFRIWSLRVLGDEALLARARAGDDSAFDALVDRHLERVCGMTLVEMANEDVADDALSSMVLSAYEGVEASGVECTAATSLYMYGIPAVFRRQSARDRGATAGPNRGESSSACEAPHMGPVASASGSMARAPHRPKAPRPGARGSRS